MEKTCFFTIYLQIKLSDQKTFIKSLKNKVLNHKQVKKHNVNVFELPYKTEPCKSESEAISGRERETA